MHTVPEALADLRVLQILKLDGNKMSKYGNTLVHYPLHLHYRLDVGPLNGLKDSLVELSVSFNHLSSIPSDLLQSLSSLKILDLSKNRIESVAANWRIGNLQKVSPIPLFLHLHPSLQLHLAANRLTSLSSPPFFAHSPALSHLDLSFNQIHTLSPNAFSTLLALDTVFLQVLPFPSSLSLNFSLQHNLLKVIPRESLIAQTSLHTLVLDSNVIESLPTQVSPSFLPPPLSSHSHSVNSSMASSRSSLYQF